MDFDAGKREVVLGTWDEQAEERTVNALVNADVISITGEKGNFVLKVKGAANKWLKPATPGTPNPANQRPDEAGKVQEIRAENIILAIGTQGNPNLMRVAGGDLPHIQYQLDDPAEYVDEHITVVGSGDAGIENALGLAADAEQGNVVTILNRGPDFARAKGANVKLLMEARDSGRVNVLVETSPSLVEPGWLTVDTRDGPQRFQCDRIIARMGSAAPAPSSRAAAPASRRSRRSTARPRSRCSAATVSPRWRRSASPARVSSSPAPTARPIPSSRRNSRRPFPASS
jgi:pyruvate/2-oxoglutarate dehydrogenase complex dihydrolipoamide dehydrogenase (E3) component